MSRKRQLTIEEVYGAGGTIRMSVGDGHDEDGGDLPQSSVGNNPEAPAKAKCKRRSRAAARSSRGPRRSRESSSSDTASSELWEPEDDPNSGDSSPDSPRATSPAVSGVLAQSSSTSAVKRRPTVVKDKDSTWQKSGWEPTVFPFTATPGPLNAAAELQSTSPADFLELFLTDELLLHITEQTNLYAQQHFLANPEIPQHSRKRAWKPVTVPELKKFFALSFLTGVIHKPTLAMYWNVDEMFVTPFFTKIMSRNRFQLIWRFLHYNDNSAIDVTDRLYKVRHVYDYLINKFKVMFQPGKNICIDEGMLLWRGRLAKVHDPQKPIKYGIKSYVLCDSATGYCFNLQPYVGEPRTIHDIVFSLLDRLPGAGHTLFLDNYYNSVALSEQLMAVKTNVCGTLRKNRGEPESIRDVTKTELSVEGRVAVNNGKVMVVAWRDRQIVKMLTTCHHDKMTSVDVWQRRQREKVSVLKPECVDAYNSSMNGVDRLDQNIKYYPFVRKSQNWTKKFVAYLFQIAMYNAYTLYKARNGNREYKTLLEFMQGVIRSWTLTVQEEDEEDIQAEKDIEAEKDIKDEENEVDIKDEESELVVACVVEGAPRNPRAPYNTDPESRLDKGFRHKEEYLLSSGSKTRPSKRCRVCARKGLRRETRVWCKACGVPLHKGECFTKYHTQIDYTM